MTEAQDGGALPPARDFADVIWEIGERRWCDEVHVYYSCGHRMRVDVFIPALPKAHEYVNPATDRRRFMLHSFHVMTRDLGEQMAPKVQITIPEGRCRHCGCGQRKTLHCGCIQVPIEDTQDQENHQMFQLMRQFSHARRLEYVFPSHIFLAAMGKDCRFPDGIEPPPLQSNGSLTGPVPPMYTEGPLQNHELNLRNGRQDVEDSLSHDVVRYWGLAMCMLLVFMALWVYFLLSLCGFAEWGIVADMGSISTTGFVDSSFTNNPWLFSVLSYVRQFANGSTDSTSTSSSWWSYIMQPICFVITSVLVISSWVLNIIYAIPSSKPVLYNIFDTMTWLVWCPCSWVFSLIASVLNNPTGVFSRLARPASIDQFPLLQITNALISAALLCILLVVLSSPQPLSLSLQSIWGELPSLGLAKSGDEKKGSLQRLWRRKDNGKSKGNHAAGKASKEKSGDKENLKRNSKTDTGIPSRPSSTQTDCFVCHSRCANYLLEPCGHQVVCGSCAMELVAMASRGRHEGENPNNHRSSQRTEGGCPSCSSVVKQAMRIFT